MMLNKGLVCSIWCALAPKQYLLDSRLRSHWALTMPIDDNFTGDKHRNLPTFDAAIAVVP